jgi:RNA polymerase sigma-70 factor, ECF subfamily
MEDMRDQSIGNIVEAADTAPGDSILIAQAKAGEYGAFEQLMTRYEGRVYAMAYRITRRREDAEDVAQTAFMSAFEHLAGFREESSFATWVTRIAVNAALKVLRKRKGLPTVAFDESTHALAVKSDLREEGDIPHPDYIADWRGDPAKLVARKELRKLMDEAIEELPEKHRVVFVLRDLQEMSVRETAEALGISEANVKVRLLRARLALREKLTRIFGDKSQRVTRDFRHDQHRSTNAAVLLKSYSEDEPSARSTGRGVEP